MRPVGAVVAESQRVGRERPGAGPAGRRLGPRKVVLGRPGAIAQVARFHGKRHVSTCHARSQGFGPVLLSFSPAPSALRLPRAARTVRGPRATRVGADKPAQIKKVRSNRLRDPLTSNQRCNQCPNSCILLHLNAGPPPRTAGRSHHRSALQPVSKFLYSTTPKRWTSAAHRGRASSPVGAATSVQFSVLHYT